jgi:hypothetical protein
MGVKVGRQIVGLRLFLCLDSWQGIGGHRQGAATKKFGKLLHGMDSGWAFQFSVGIVGGKKIAPAGVGENAEHGNFGISPSNRPRAAEEYHRAMPDGGHAIGRGDA